MGVMSAEMAAAKALPTAASDQSAASAVCEGGMVRVQWLGMEEAQRTYRSTRICWTLRTASESTRRATLANGASRALMRLRSFAPHAPASPIKVPATLKQRMRAKAVGWLGEPGRCEGAAERSPLRE